MTITQPRSRMFRSLIPGLCVSLLALPATAQTTDETETATETEVEIRTETKVINTSKLNDMVEQIIRQTEDGQTVEIIRLKSHDLADKARDAGNSIADSDLLGNMNELINELATRLEVERGEGDGTALLFDGDEMLRFKLDREGAIENSMSITGLGRNVTVERETVIKDGQTRTRIVIEMDGGDDIEIDMPDSPDAPTPPEPLQD